MSSRVCPSLVPSSGPPVAYDFAQAYHAQLSHPGTCVPSGAVSLLGHHSYSEAVRGVKLSCLADEINKPMGVPDGSEPPLNASSRRSGLGLQSLDN